MEIWRPCGPSPGVKSAHVATRYDAPTPVETGLEPLMAGSTEGIGSDVVNAMGYDGRGKKSGHFGYRFGYGS